MFRKATIPFALVALTLAACTAGPSEDLSSSSVDIPQRMVLDEKAPIWLAEQNVPSMAVAMIGRRGVAWTAVYGEQAPGEPATESTLYNIASLTKPLTAETILALAEDGQIALDASVADVYMDPDLADDPLAHKLTLRNLLSHRSGFPANWRRLMPEGRLQIEWEPGTRAAYSGENYELAANYASTASGRSLDELARDYLFIPQGIADIWFTSEAAWDGRVAMVRGEDGTLRLPDANDRASAADNVHATIGDYGRFVDYAMNGSGLSADLLSARGTIYDDQTEQACPQGIIPPELCPVAAGFGLGWQIYDSGENRFMMHSGKDWGERTIALFEPEKKFGLVIFTSGANGRQVISDTMELLVPDVKLNALVAAEARYERMQRGE